MKEKILKIISKYSNDKTRLMDILHDIQSLVGFVDSDAIEMLHQKLGVSESQVKEVISFYHFFSCKPLAKVNIYLNNSVTSNMHGRKGVLAAFENAIGIKEGCVSSDGEFGLFSTACIGMNDQSLLP